ncbi:unnamed protein product [Rhodiola kirilowii]
MGKKAKKKAGTPQREKRTGATLPKTGPDSKIIPIETVEAVASAVKEKKGCVHIEKGVNLVELAVKDWSVRVACEDCRENAGDRRGGRGKSKADKKKGHSVEAIWVCLQCGHRACGGVGLPTTPQSHAVRHARQARHPLAVNYENPQLRWCFQCSTLIPVAKFEEKGEHKDVISDAVMIIQNKSTREASGDVEDSRLGGESVKTVLVDNSITSGKDYYVVRGLMNLGNTCFFNSVMQNLLAMDELRGYFSSLDGSYRPLTVSLKKLFDETGLDTGHKGAVNPKSFFGCVCARAPQFRGYQQQDSHELLRCLLDGLSTEELNVSKQIKMIHESVPPNPVPSFVDAAFGGQASSTVCCLECGHASTVYEPFLDLSLPVPTRKPPKKTQHLSVAKKAKVPVPPKRAAKIHAKPKKDPNCDPNLTKIESVCESSQEASSSGVDHEVLGLHQDKKEDDMSWLDFPDTAPSSIRSDGIDQSSADHLPQLQGYFPNCDAEHSSCADSAGVDSINPNVVPGPEVLGVHQDKKEDDMSWLDFLDTGTNSGEQEINIEDFDAFGTVDSGYRNDESMHNTSDSGLAVSEAFNDRTFSSLGNTGDDEVPLLVQDSEVLLLPYKEECSPNLEIMEGQASSSLTAQDEDASGFSGFGDLFNEPEPAIGPSARPDSESNMKDSGTSKSFLSESDPDEVDDAAPVSIETCLAYFTKPELLLREQGWYCEKCSKVVQRERRKSEKKHATNDANNQSIDLEVGPRRSEKCPPSFNQRGRLSNGETVENGANNLLIHNGDVDDDENEMRTVQDSVDSSHTNGVTDMNNSANEDSSLISFSSDSICADELSVECTIGEVPVKDSGDVSGDDVEEKEDTESSSVKVARDATKRLLIEKAPPILTIHLKRFSQDVRGRLSKLNGHVAFGETIDLRPYMNPRCTDEEKYIYHLSGIVEHLGTMRGGHYVAYIRGGKKNIWYHASDAYVREASFEEVLRSEAYILFYKQI